MKKLLFTIILSLIPVVGLAATLFTFTPPTTNTDGTLLTDLGGYKIYCGQASGDYSVTMDIGLIKPDITGKGTYPIANVLNMDVTKTWYCVMTAYDINKNESVYSNEVSVPLVGLAPNVPGAFGVK